MLRTALARGAREPIVNGYTRTVRGFIQTVRGQGAVLPPGGSIAGETQAPGDSLYIEAVVSMTSNSGGYYLTQNGIEIGAGPTPQQAIGIGTIMHNYDGNGADYFAAIEVADQKMRSWKTGLAPYGQAYPLAQGTKLYARGIANAHENPLGARFAGGPSISMFRRRDVEFKNGEPFGYVLGYLNNGPAIRADFDAAGNGLLKIPDDYAVPVKGRFSAVYEIHAGPAKLSALAATLRVPSSYSGDVISYIRFADHSPALPGDPLYIGGNAGPVVLDWRASEAGAAGVLAMPNASRIGGSLRQYNGSAPSISTSTGRSELLTVGAGCGFYQPLAHPDDFTAYILARIIAGAGADGGAFYTSAGLYMAEDGGSVADWGLGFNAANKVVIGGQSTTAISAAAIDTAGYHVITLQRNKATGQLRALVDGVEVASCVFLVGSALNAGSAVGPYFGITASLSARVIRFFATGGLDSQAQIDATVSQLHTAHGV